GPPIAAAAAIVHIEYADAAARPVLDPQVERRRGRRGRAAMALDQERRFLAVGRRVIGVRRRIIEAIRGSAVATRKGDELWAGEIRCQGRAKLGRRLDDRRRAAGGI